MTLRTLLAVAAVTTLSACSPQALLAGLANNVAGPQIYETMLTAVKQDYLSNQKLPAARVDCIMGRIRDQVKPADLTNLQTSPDGKIANNGGSEKLSAARKAAEAACPN